MKKISVLFLLIALFGCSKEEATTISAVRINKIRVTQYPITNGAVPWDDPFLGSATGPDISWRLSGPQTVTSSTYFPDVSGGTLEYTGNGFPITLNSPQSSYTFSIYDLDDLDGSDFGSTDDLMGSIVFTPYSSGSKGTETVEFTGQGVIVQMELTYLFE